MPEQTQAVTITGARTDRAFLTVEHTVYAAIGLLLTIIAVVALITALIAAPIFLWEWWKTGKRMEERQKEFEAQEARVEGQLRESRLREQ